MELGVDDLHFSVDETSEFLEHRVHTETQPDIIANLQARLEGWAAGLQLFALGLERRHGNLVNINFSGTHRFVADYLREDVLVAPGPDCQRFLLQSSILDSLCGSLCDAVTAEPHGRSMLELVEKKNFLSCRSMSGGSGIAIISFLEIFEGGAASHPS